MSAPLEAECAQGVAGNKDERCRADHRVAWATVRAAELVLTAVLVTSVAPCATPAPY